MDKRKKLVIGSVVAIAALGTGTAAAVATADDQETPIAGEALKRASAAALEHTGGGRVTETEQGDEDAYYEVEVTMQDGSEVDVHLDRDFNVVDAAADADDPNDAD